MMNLPPELPSSAPDEALAPVFLGRLTRLVRLRRELNGDLNPLGADLIDRAIVATVRDCDDAGAGPAARSLLRKAS
jgi:hypothetical protein